MRLIISGWHGQIARALADEALSSPDVEAFAIGRPALDVRDPRSVERAFADVNPDLVINTAAYTAVDKAESEPDLAFLLNRDGARRIAQATARRNVPIIHLSTHYVFDGMKSAPYVETDAARPTTVYGRSKLEGEEAVCQVNPHHVIVRTGWVYSATGRNFFTRVIDLASKTEGPLEIVGDQRGNPTYAPHFATLLLALARRLLTEAHKKNDWGIYHVAGTGSATWYEFAEEISNNLEMTGNRKIAINSISTARYSTTTRRPPNCMLDCSRFESTFSLRLPTWREGVQSSVVLRNRTIGS
jgi:dTDP-4-dehydrorhamnose reductase